MGFCCTECFSDPSIREFIETEGQQPDAPCEYCGADGAMQIEASRLGAAFHTVIEHHYLPFSELSQAHHEDPMNGEFLWTLLNEDFQVFEDSLIPSRDRGKLPVERLLGDIMEDYDDDFGHAYYAAEDLWFRTEDDWLNRSGEDLHAETWHALLPAIQQHGHSLRLDGAGAFGATEDALEAARTLSETLEQVASVLDSPAELWRARRGRHKEVTALRAPPPHLVGAQRANLQGQPRLYVADNRDTAVAEIRPSKGDTVSVARFRLTRSVRVCDLASTGVGVSPFGDWTAYLTACGRLDVARALGAVFSEPVRAGDEPKEYLPSQYLANLILEKGFDGIAYESSQRSSWPPARNFVFFDPAIAEPVGGVQAVLVRAVSYTIDDAN